MIAQHIAKRVQRLVPILGLCLGLIGAGLMASAQAQPLEGDTGSDQMEALETAQHLLEQRFAVLAFDDGSWSAHMALCKGCQEQRPEARYLAPDLPRDPLGPLNLAQVQARIEAQQADYDSRLWKEAAISQAALTRYIQRCTDCKASSEIDRRKTDILKQNQSWRADRAACQAAAAPRQYGGGHRWQQDQAAANLACQAAWAKAPEDPWAAYLLWRSQADDKKDGQLLSYAVEHAVPPALAAAAWQALARPPHDLARARRLAETASETGDFNAMVVAALIEQQQGVGGDALLARLQPALEKDHPWALQIAAKLEALPALKIAYLGLAAQQGDPRAQSALLRAWEANLSGHRLRQQAARAHIAAVVQDQPRAKTMWFENGDKRPQRLVKAVQAELIGLGLLSGSPDGVWGKNSAGALRKVTAPMVRDWIQVADTSGDDSDDPADDLASTPDPATDQSDQLASSQQAPQSPDGEGDGEEKQAPLSKKPAPDLLASTKSAADETSQTSTEETAAEAASYAPSTAPLPKPKGDLALVDPEAKEEQTSKKRGTVFKRKP